MLDADTIRGQIDGLIAAHDDLQGRSKYPDDLSDLRSESNELVVRLRSAIFRLALDSGAYAEEAEAIGSQQTHIRIPKYLGILRAMRADIDQGWISTIEELIHAETYSDFLDMAKELLDKGYKDPAAVLAGSVLETNLRGMCIRNNVDPNKANGTPKRADTVNVELRKAAVYNLLQQKQITAWLGLRNDAAHGNFDEYDQAQVADLVAGIRNFLLKYPA